MYLCGRDHARVAVAYAVGLVICAVGWHQASGQDNLGDQVVPLNLALAGGLIAGAGNVWWVLKGRRAIGGRRRQLLTDAQLPARRQVVTRTATAPADLVVTGEGLRHFHRGDCPMVRDRGWVEVARADGEQTGRRPCGICRP